MNEKAIIYNRTSTKDQNPQLQLKDCQDFAKEKSLVVISIIEEQASAYKGKQQEWNKVVDLAKEHEADIILWRYDRAFRNRKEFYEFMRTMFEVYGIKVYSVKEPSILTLWELMSKTEIDDPVVSELVKGIVKEIWKYLIQISGEQAEEESRKKGERVRLAVVKKDGEQTLSYKGNTWGRKPIQKKAIDEVIELHKQGLSIRKIAKQVHYYDSNRNKKLLGISTVHKILKENLPVETS